MNLYRLILDCKISYRALSLIFLSIVLCACSPSLNWRQVKLDGISVLFPAKPATLERPVTLLHRQWPMRMSAAQVDGISYAVGVIAINTLEKNKPNYLDEATQLALLKAMQAAMLANIKGNIIASTQDQGYLKIKAQGQNQNNPIELHAYFFSTTYFAYQAVVMGPPNQIPPDAIDTFFDSVKK